MYTLKDISYASIVSLCMRCHICDYKETMCVSYVFKLRVLGKWEVELAANRICGLPVSYFYFDT